MAVEWHLYTSGQSSFSVCRASQAAESSAAPNGFREFRSTGRCNSLRVCLSVLFFFRSSFYAFRTTSNRRQAAELRCGETRDENETASRSKWQQWNRFRSISSVVPHRTVLKRCFVAFLFIGVFFISSSGVLLFFAAAAVAVACCCPLGSFWSFTRMCVRTIIEHARSSTDWWHESIVLDLYLSTSAEHALNSFHIYQRYLMCFICVVCFLFE